MIKNYYSIPKNNKRYGSTYTVWQPAKTHLMVRFRCIQIKYKLDNNDDTIINILLVKVHAREYKTWNT